MSGYCKVDPKNLITIEALTDEFVPSFSGIVAGLCKGDVFVDSATNPKIALVYSIPVGGFEVLGKLDTNEEWKQLEAFIKGEFFLWLKQHEMYEFEFVASVKETEEQLLHMFQDYDIKKETELTLRPKTDYSHDMDNEQLLSSDARTSKDEISGISVPEGYQVKIVDEEVLHQISDDTISNGCLLLDDILSAFDDIDSFLRESVAVVTICEQRIVAVLVGTAKFHDYLPIDIITEEEHRKKGIASAMTRLFVNECYKRGYHAQWDCMEYNQASYRTALRCEFELVHTANLYWFSI